jgi:pimeloyl-ACP methyl ester carboxylesterase
MSTVLRTLLLASILLAVGSARAQQGTQERPVAAVAEHRVVVAAPEGSGELPVYLSRDWEAPLPGVTEVVVIVHGALRNADDYLRSAAEALANSGVSDRATLLVAPQFLVEPDIRAHALPDTVLRWSVEGWKGGEPAEGPAAISSFAAFDAILDRLADRQRFPDLARVVMAGHSAGAQVVQRYAVAGRGEEALARARITMRYVVANPSSYLYFDGDRPQPDGRFAPFAEAASCPSFDRWKYGLTGAPAYVGSDGAALERQYAARDVVYLLGTADTDPNHRLLDRSCAGMAEGSYRYARGLAYFRYLQAREGAALKHRVVEVAGVGHDNRAMFNSACGLAVLFGRPGC